MTNRKIIVVPWRLKSWSKASGRDQALAGRASWVRMTSASMPASDEERERGEEVADADPLVVDGGQEADDPRRLGPDLLQPFDVRFHYFKLSR